MKRDITELVKETITEIREKGNTDTSSDEFTENPLIANNVLHMGQIVPFLGLAYGIDDGVLIAIKTLMILSYQTGIKVGRKEVMDQYLPKEDDDEIGGLD